MHLILTMRIIKDKLPKQADETEETQDILDGVTTEEVVVDE